MKNGNVTYITWHCDLNEINCSITQFTSFVTLSNYAIENAIKS